MNKFIIYAIINPNGSIYVGQTVNFRKRINRYKVFDCKNQRYLHHSLIKFGFNSHEIKILHELPTDVDRTIMDNYELFYYTLYKNAGFKMMNVKQAFGKGGEIHPETREKLRQANFKRIYKPCSAQTKEKIRLANLGRKNGPPSEATKIKISLAQKGRKGRAPTNAEREHLRITSTGKKLSQVAKDKVKQARSIPILQLDKNNNIIKEWSSAKKACDELNLSRCRMCVILKRTTKNIYRGFKWVKNNKI